MSDSAEPTANQLSGVQEFKRLGRNHNGYLGATIDIGVVLGECVSAAGVHGWSAEEILPGLSPKLLALTRVGSGAAQHSSPAASSLLQRRRRIYLSTGIHGDEPAGPLALRQLLQDNRWPADADLWLCPCLNPTGFVLNRREDGEGIDLNREYLQPKAKETRAHIAWLERQPSFDLCLCLHEDWEAHGFYVYELNPDNLPSLAEPIVARAAELCPIDRSEIIEGRPAKDGIIRPSIDPRTRPQWPESFFLLMQKTRLSYTLEAPSDFPLSARVACLVSAVNAALEAFPAARS